MLQPVHVPHRGPLPQTQFARGAGFNIAACYSSSSLDRAYDIASEEYQAYAGFPDVQASVLAAALDDVEFASEVATAAARIGDVVKRTHLFTYQGIRVKNETEQPTRAYKVRGATNFILKHADQAESAGVITASAGNHGQAVALAATKIGIEAMVVVPEGTPEVKRVGIEAQGGRVIVFGRDYAAASQKALEINERQHGLYVPAFDHRDIMAGQATLAAELVEQVPDMTDLFVPVGGGGLLAGIAKYLRGTASSVHLTGSGVSGLSAFENAKANGNIGLSASSQFAEGIAVAQLGALTWSEIKRSEVAVASVDEQGLKRFVGQLGLAGYVLEGAGAVSLYAALQSEHLLTGQTVAIASGGNIDPNVLAACQAQAALPVQAKLTDQPAFSTI